MNANELNFENNNNNNVYRATSNLNTAIENPNVDIDSAMNVNIQNNLNNISLDNNSTNSIDNSVIETNNNQNVFINNVSNDSNLNFSDNFQNSGSFNVENAYEDDSNNKVSYQPTLNQKKKPSSGFLIPKEVKAMVIIVIVLLITMFIIPYIYDFFKNLSLGIIS